MKDDAYLAWREAESYQVPMTAEGEEKAQQRWLNFRKGWNAALQASVAKLMDEHDMNDHIHNIYHVSANIVKTLESK